MRAAASRAPYSTAHTMAYHGAYGNGNKESVNKSNGGIDGGAMCGIYRGIEVMSNIAEAGVGMVEAITQIYAAQQPTSAACAGALIRLSHLRRENAVNQGQSNRDILRLHRYLGNGSTSASAGIKWLLRGAMNAIKGGMGKVAGGHVASPSAASTSNHINSWDYHPHPGSTASFINGNYFN